MSRLRIELLRKLPEFQKQANKIKCHETKRRWMFIKCIVKSRSSVKQACLKIGVSEEWFRKWGQRLLKAGVLETLKSRSRRPKKSPRRLKPIWAQRILTIRNGRPFEGCERIAHRIEEIFDKRISFSVVNKVLKRAGLISAEAQKKLTKAHTKRYRRDLPGYLQMDFKYVPFRIGGRQFYQLSCVDHHSSWRMIRIYERKDMAATENFLYELLENCPFPILEIQTDNDLAFTHKFWKLNMGFDPTFEHAMSEWCIENQVRHKLIPVGQKELNGKVENTHKQDDREFYSQITPQNIEHLRLLAREYEKRWNEQRKTKALKWLTPIEALRKAFAVVFLWALRNGLELPSNVVQIPRRPKNQKIAKGPKRKTHLDRYLEWMEEDAKKYGNDG